MHRTGNQLNSFAIIVALRCFALDQSDDGDKSYHPNTPAAQITSLTLSAFTRNPITAEEKMSNNGDRRASSSSRVGGGSESSYRSHEPSVASTEKEQRKNNVRGKLQSALRAVNDSFDGRSSASVFGIGNSGKRSSRAERDERDAE